jgi:hypothetical protein
MSKSVRVFLFALLALAGCSNPIVIYDTISPSAAQSLDSGQSVTLTATVFNDPSNSGVTWSLLGAGTLTSKTAMTVTYTAPAGVTAAATASVEATPVKNTLFVAATEIILAPSPVIATNSLPNGTVGIAYSDQLTSTGGASPLVWALSNGTLPTGLSLSASGLISGTPTIIGSSTFTVQITDSATTPRTYSETLTLIVIAPMLTITTATIPNGVVGTPISDQLTLIGGIAPYTWSVASGTLPMGVTLSSTGLLSGTPATSAIYTFTAQVTDTEPTPQIATKPFTFTVYNALKITTTTLPNGSLKDPYPATTLQYTGGTPSVTWTVSGLPAGLSYSAATNTITGTPTAVGTSTVNLTLIDSSTPKQTATATLSLTVVLSTLAITTTSLPQGTIGAPYSATLQSSGGNPPVTWAVTGLPGGLSYSASTGVISGTPTTANTYPITATATDTTPASVTANLSIAIVALAPLTLTTTTISAGNIDTAYSTTFAATGGAVPYSWSVTNGALPQGLSLATSTGILSGIPLAAGSYNFTVQVADSEATPVKASRAFTLTIGTTLPTGANNSQLTGRYGFLIKGFNYGNTSGAVYGFAELGSLSFNGSGAITGTEYSNATNGVQSAVPVSGSYTLGTDGRGLMVLTAATNTNVYTIAAINPVSGIAQSFAISEFDNSTGATGAANASGIAKLQTTAAFLPGTLSGTFAFGLSGESPCSSCVTPAPLYGPVVSVGTFTANGVATISSGQEDAASYGLNYTGITLAGTFTTPSTATGAGTLHLTTTGTLYGSSPSDFDYLIISANEMLLMSSDSHATTALLSGDAQLQKQTTYTATSLTGAMVGYESSGNGGNGSTVYPAALNAIVDYVTITGSGTATLAQDANRAGTFTSNATAPTAITYTMATNGRTAITTNGTSNQVLYLYNTDTGFALDQAATSTYPGLLQYTQQVDSNTPYPVLLSGSFAANTLPTAIATTEVSGMYVFALNTGGVNAGISGDLTTFIDSSTTAGTLSLDTSAPYLYTESSTGRHVVTNSGTTTAQSIIYGITSALAVSIPASSTTTPTVTTLQLY